MSRNYHQCGFVGNIDTPSRYKPEHHLLPPIWPQNVYFIQGHPDGSIKIGWAANPYLRLAKLQLASPVPLELLSFQEGGQQLEFSYHQRFQKYRQHGEWFEPAAEIIQMAAEVSLPPFPRPKPLEPIVTGQYGPWKPRSLLIHARGARGRFVPNPVDENPIRFEPDRETFAEFCRRRETQEHIL